MPELLFFGWTVHLNTDNGRLGGILNVYSLYVCFYVTMFCKCVFSVWSFKSLVCSLTSSMKTFCLQTLNICTALLPEYSGSDCAYTHRHKVLLIIQVSEPHKSYQSCIYFKHVYEMVWYVCVMTCSPSSFSWMARMSLADLTRTFSSWTDRDRASFSFSKCYTKEISFMWL